MEALFGSIPAKVYEIVPIAVPVAKVVMLALIAVKYSSSQHMPFTRNVYQFASLGAIMKILFFQGHSMGLNLSPAVSTLAEDLSFICILIGIGVTTGLDFLWSLSSSLEGDALFSTSTSENEFVAAWTRVEIVLIAAMAGIRYLPLPFNPDLTFNWSVNVVCVVSFGFIWYCLWRVWGSSKSRKFLEAYKSAFICTTVMSIIIFQHVMETMVPSRDFERYFKPYVLMHHIAESLASYIMFAYFAYVKAPPSDLKDHITSFSSVGGVLKAKQMFKQGLGKKKKET